MLVPVKQHMPSRLDPGETIIVSLEDVAPVMPVYFPRLFFINTATVSNVRIVVKQKFVVGPSADPLLSANFTSTKLDIVLTPLANRTTVQLDSIAVDGVLDFHTIEITNQGAVEEIVHTWFEGLYEETLVISPTFPPTVL